MNWLERLLVRLGIIATPQQSAWLDWADQYVDLIQERRRIERRSPEWGGPGSIMYYEWRRNWESRMRALRAIEPQRPEDLPR